MTGDVSWAYVLCLCEKNHVAFSYVPADRARNLNGGCSNQELLEILWNFVRKCEYGQADRHTHDEACIVLWPFTLYAAVNHPFMPLQTASISRGVKLR